MQLACLPPPLLYGLGIGASSMCERAALVYVKRSHNRINPIDPVEL